MVDHENPGNWPVGLVASGQGRTPGEGERGRFLGGAKYASDCGVPSYLLAYMCIQYTYSMLVFKL